MGSMGSADSGFRQVLENNIAYQGARFAGYTELWVGFPGHWVRLHCCQVHYELNSSRFIHRMG